MVHRWARRGTDGRTRPYYPTGPALIGRCTAIARPLTPEPPHAITPNHNRPLMGSFPSRRSNLLLLTPGHPMPQIKIFLAVVAFGVLMAYPQAVLGLIEGIANWPQSWTAIWLAVSVIPVSVLALLAIAWGLA